MSGGQKLRILMVSGEYPPMTGGVARYTQNLVQALDRRPEVEGVLVATSFAGSPDGPGSHPATFRVIQKGDRKNSDRLLQLVSRTQPDIVNIQYERGLYEVDTTVRHTLNRIMHGSTLDRFFRLCPVPTVSTLHTVFPYREYQDYVGERARRKEGRFGFLPTPLRAMIRRWVMERRYDLLLQVVRLSTEVISPAETVRDVVKKGTVIYHGAEPAVLSAESRQSATSNQSTSGSAQATGTVVEDSKQEFRLQFGLPLREKLLLAFGYAGSYKGFDLLEKMELPSGWSLVVKQTRHERGVERPLALKGTGANSIVSLDLGYMDDATMSKLFLACDAIIFPYRVVSISGVMFDALAHGLPFVASDLKFFEEFARMGLGITAKRDSDALSGALLRLAGDFRRYKGNVEQFAGLLKWDRVAAEHVQFYYRCLGRHDSRNAKRMLDS